MQLGPHFIHWRQMVAADQDLGAVAEVAIGVDRNVRRRHGWSRSVALDVSQEGRVPLDVAHYAFEHPHEAFPASVHHAGFLEQGHQLGGSGQGGFAFFQKPLHEIPDIRGLGGNRFSGNGGVPGDGENRAFARVLQRLVEPIRARANGSGDVGCARDLDCPERLGEARSGNGPASFRSCPGRRERRRGRWCWRFPEGSVAERAERVGDGAQGQAEVGAGVSIRHGKYVDPVDFVPAGGHPIGGCEESIAPVEVHRRTAIPTVIAAGLLRDD